MLSERVCRAAFVPILLSLVVPVLAFAANGTLTADQDGWFINKMILEHDATFVSLSVPVLTFVLFTLSWMAKEGEPEPIIRLSVALGFFLTLLAGGVTLIDDREFRLGSAGQHYWLIAIFAFQTLSPLIALWWLAKKLEKHRQPELPSTINHIGVRSNAISDIGIASAGSPAAYNLDH